jgi:hypothetical protein
VTGDLERALDAIAFVAIVCLGLQCRWPALGLPLPVAKYAGSGLWGAMVYTGVRATAPRNAVARSAAAWCVIAICVELFRLHRRPELDAFRATLAGKLLLGSHFSPWNVVAYVAGIVCAASLDAVHRSRFRGSRPNSRA